MDLKDLVVLATIDRSRGLRGEVVATSRAGGSEAFLDRTVTLRRGLIAERQAHIENAWDQNGRVVLKLRGVETIEAAEALRGCEICVLAADRPPLEEGEYYLSDLVGCELFDAAQGKSVGPVTGWQDVPGSVLLTVRHGDREAMVPFVKAICTEVDLANRRIVANLPDGLLDL